MILRARLLYMTEFILAPIPLDIDASAAVAAIK
jgi:hypothetical protein